MRIRTRLTLWFAVVLIVSLLALSVRSYYELVVEPREHARHARGSVARVEEADSAMNEIGEAMLWCGVPALILGLGGGWWLMRRALAPITELTRAVERVNEHYLSE